MISLHPSVNSTSLFMFSANNFLHRSPYTHRPAPKDCSILVTSFLIETCMSFVILHVIKFFQSSCYKNGDPYSDKNCVVFLTSLAASWHAACHLTSWDKYECQRKCRILIGLKCRWKEGKWKSANLTKFESSAEGSAVVNVLQLYPIDHFLLFRGRCSRFVLLSHFRFK